MARTFNLRKVGVGVLAAAAAGGAAGGAIVLSNGGSGHTRAIVVKSKHAQISVGYNSYVIGNAYPGWTEFLQGPNIRSAGPGNRHGGIYRLAFIIGPNYRSCGWLQSYTWVKTGRTTTSRCDSPHWTRAGRDPNFHSWFRANFTNGHVSSGKGDASPTVLNFHNRGCTTTTGFGNVEPWKKHESGSQPVPIKTTDGMTDKIGWRYVTRSRQFVMVHDYNSTAGQPNWYFVQRQCLAPKLVG